MQRKRGAMVGVRRRLGRLRVAPGVMRRVLVVAIALAGAAAVEAIGIAPFVDAAFDAVWHDVRGPAPRDTDVVVVAIDDAALALAESDVERVLVPVLNAINADGPALVVDAVCPLGPPCRSRHAGVEGEALRGATAAELQQDFVRGSFGQVRSVDTGTVRLPALVRRLASVAGQVIPGEGVQPIRFVGQRDALPHVSPSRILRGALPAGTFKERTVVVDVVASSLGPTLETPLGRMSPGETLAQALSGWRRDDFAAAAPWSARIVWRALLVLATLLVLVRAPVRAMLAGAAVAVIVDLGAFLGDLPRSSVGGDLAAVVATVVAAVVVERRGVARAAARLQAFIEQDGTQHRGHEHFWDGLVAQGALYLGTSRGVVAELPEGSFWFVPRAFQTGGYEQIAEPRRDVRRPPYRDAYLRHVVTVADRWIKPELQQRTWIVPLVASRKVVGFWCASFPADAPPLEGERLALAERLASEMATAIEAHARRFRAQRPLTRRLLDDGPLLAVLDRLDVAVLASLAEADTLRALVTRSIVGIGVADLQGTLASTNDALTRVLAYDGVDVGETRNLMAVLARLSGRTPADVLRLTHDVLVSDDARVIVDVDGTGRALRATYVLTRLPALDREGATEPARLVLTAVPRASAPTGDESQGAPPTSESSPSSATKARPTQSKAAQSKAAQSKPPPQQQSAPTAPREPAQT